MGQLIGVAALVIITATGSNALSCFACVPRQQIAGVSLPATIANKTVYFPRCDQLQTQAPEERFRMTCPAGLNLSCIKIRDDRGNEMRSCFSSAEERCTKTTKQGQVLCMCKGDFCNPASAPTPASGWAVVVLLSGLFLARY